MKIFQPKIHRTRNGHRHIILPMRVDSISLAKVSRDRSTESNSASGDKAQEADAMAIKDIKISYIKPLKSHCGRGNSPGLDKADHVS
jgi:hypothetical protein